MTPNPDREPTAPISEDAEMKQVATTCLYMISPEVQQYLAQTNRATEEPSPLLDEDSEDEEEFEGTNCWYCEDIVDHDTGRCNYLRELTAEEQRDYLQVTATCIKCLELEEQSLQHSCKTSDICTSCDDPHHSIIKCEVFPLTQISEPTSEAGFADKATVEENDDVPLTREDS